MSCTRIFKIKISLGESTSNIQSGLSNSVDGSAVTDGPDCVCLCESERRGRMIQTDNGTINSAE